MTDAIDYLEGYLKDGGSKMKAKDVKWCPQHGYPLPCYKCGHPLSGPQQKEIFEAGAIEAYECGVYNGKAEGIAEGIKEVARELGLHCYLWHDGDNKQHTCIDMDTWQVKLKEWGI